jgi:hypothetical protein
MRVGGMVAFFNLPKDTGLLITLAVVSGYLLIFILIHVAAPYSFGIILCFLYGQEKEWQLHLIN